MGKRRDSNFLDSLIKILIIFLLLGVILIVGLYLKEMIYAQDKKIIQTTPTTQKSDTNSTKKSVMQNLPSQLSSTKDATLQGSNPGQNNSTQNSNTKQKLYTEEEMQEILQMMIDQMQELKEEESNDSVNKSQSEQNDDLAQTLLSIEDDEDNPVQNIPKDIQADKVQAKENSTKDTYNKVVLEDNSYSDDNIDKLSSEIGSLIKSVETQTKTDDGKEYTNEIKKEVKTREDSMRIIVVRRGDTLSKIALRAYGSIKAYTKILKANRDLIKNPNRIYVGQRLRIPNF
jgi:xanthosine utilization system XapX-like protein/phage tail protein X